eukprot:SAG31_NODE_223_length_19859_cov_14.949899_7_plen_187_part_00
MAAVHARETETSCGQLITVRATGSDELISTAHEEKEGSARPGVSAVSGDFLPVFGFISLPKCGGWNSYFHGISGSVASCSAVSHLDESLTLFDERHFISRCALHLCTSNIESSRQRLTQRHFICVAAVDHILLPVSNSAFRTQSPTRTQPSSSASASALSVELWRPAIFLPTTSPAGTEAACCPSQ